jgi:hypothetical protein
MDKRVLTDSTIFPTDEVVFSHLGKTKLLWIAFFELISSEYPDISKEWRYYNDGKSWLMKVTRKAKTVFWLSVIEKYFRITFYFTDKAAQAIKSSTISKELKQQFINGKYFNKIRGLTITFKTKKDIDYTKTLIELKLKMK